MRGRSWAAWRPFQTFPLTKSECVFALVCLEELPYFTYLQGRETVSIDILCEVMSRLLHHRSSHHCPPPHHRHREIASRHSRPCSLLPPGLAPRLASSTSQYKSARQKLNKHQSDSKTIANQNKKTLSNEAQTLYGSLSVPNGKSLRDPVGLYLFPVILRNHYATVSSATSSG